MARFLIDANLPYRFALWHGEDFLHVYDLGDDMPDAATWQFAKERDLIIVSKVIASVYLEVKGAPLLARPESQALFNKTEGKRDSEGFAI